MVDMPRRALVLLALALGCAPHARAQTTAFARLSARLSEPGGYFDTHNLVSNETSYQHVMGALRQFQILRSWLSRGMTLPSSVPGHFSTQLLQSVPR